MDSVIGPRLEPRFILYSPIHTLTHSPVDLEVTFTRSGSESLGFSLVGGVNSSKGNSPVYVRNIARNGLAAKDGRLQSGDEILKINGLPLLNMSQDQVVQVIKKTVGNVTLTINPRDVML